MRTDSTSVQRSFRLEVEGGAINARWDYDADVSFTDAQIAQLDGPAAKAIYLDITGGRDATCTFATLSAATATTALKAIAERVDKLLTLYVPADKKHDFAEVQRLAAASDCDDDDGPHHFTVTLLTDDPGAVDEYVAHRPRAPGPFPTGWPRCAAPIAVSISDNVATVTVEPHTAEFCEATKAAIVAADMQKVFIDARGLKPVDYPEDSLAFLFREATLVCAMALNCSKPGAEDDIEATHAIFDVRAEESPWVVRLFTDAPREWGEFIEKHRPVGRHCLAWPTYEPDTAAG